AEAREPAPARPAPARETQAQPAMAQPATAQPVSRRVEVDLDALADSGIVTPNAPRSALADQFRVIKRPLIGNALGKGAATLKHGNLIMVTSAIAGEGKTFTSVNLAMSIAAEMDHTVMLVDADVARPSVLRVLGLPAGPGLLDVLEGKVELSGALLRTSVDKLTILPSGTPHARATELLASDAMGALLDDMATRYPDRIIIFDSPPLLLTTESRVLATHMGQIVVVVHAGRTLQSDVQHALSTIESCPVRMMLLNRARTDSAGAYNYGYGYGAYGYSYGYGRGHGDAEALAPEASAKPA
ncbi:MAG: tyrosine-protein kinase family protein, partial [Rubrivivax sp.]|nr:tyrosine-protein kinase family protein [Rubrivivax sp.]